MCGVTEIGCILTYAGNADDTLLHWSILLLCCCCAALELRSPTPPHASHAAARASAAWQACALAAVGAYQVGPCMVLGCAGVSIIWNAVAAFVVRQRLRYRPACRCVGSPRDTFISCVAVATLCADAYYATTAEALTTVAHGCALALGAAIEWCCPYNRRRAIVHSRAGEGGEISLIHQNLGET